MTKIIEMQPEVSRLFWDTDLNSLNLQENRHFIIERVLNMGDGIALKWLWRVYDEETICDAVRHSRKLSKKTAYCWQNYFHLSKDDMRCFSMYSMSPGSFF